MERKKVARRSLVLRNGELWFGAKVVAVRPTPVPAVVLICTDELPDKEYDATHYAGSTEHYISSREFLEVVTGGKGLTADEIGALLAGLISTRQVLTILLQASEAQVTSLVHQLQNSDEWCAALTQARYLLGVSSLAPFAGATGSGKSVMLNVIITCLLTQATPDDVCLWMIDPKMVELSVYNGVPHLLAPVVTDAEQAVPLFEHAVAEMERRYRLFSQLGVRNIAAYRKLRLARLARGDMSLGNLPSIVLIVDELADLMMLAPDEVEKMICRLAQLARATGIHLVIATQRPSVDVITGLIKANIPTRISFMVSSAVDSRTILDASGAEKLLGGGDMLYLPADAGGTERVQGAFLTDEETERLTTYWRQTQSMLGAPQLDEVLPSEEERETEKEAEQNRPVAGEDDKAMITAIVEILQEQSIAWFSKTWLQKTFGVGYQKADRLTKKLIECGVIAQEAEGKRGERRVLLERQDQEKEDVDA